MYPNVRAEMKRQNLTQKELADALNITVGTLSQKLRGKRPVTLGEANEIKKALGVDMPLEKLFEVAA